MPAIFFTADNAEISGVLFGRLLGGVGGLAAGIAALDLLDAHGVLGDDGALLVEAHLDVLLADGAGGGLVGVENAVAITVEVDSDGAARAWEPGDFVVRKRELATIFVQNPSIFLDFAQMLFIAAEFAPHKTPILDAKIVVRGALRSVQIKKVCHIVLADMQRRQHGAQCD